MKMNLEGHAKFAYFGNSYNVPTRSNTSSGTGLAWFDDDHHPPMDFPRMMIVRTQIIRYHCQCIPNWQGIVLQHTLVSTHIKLPLRYCSAIAINQVNKIYIPAGGACRRRQVD